MERRHPNSPLRKVLDDEGRKQSWLAAKVGVDPADLSRIVNKGMHVDDDTKQQIAAALGRTVDELWPESQAA